MPRTLRKRVYVDMVWTWIWFGNTCLDMCLDTCLDMRTRTYTRANAHMHMQAHGRARLHVLFSCSFRYGPVLAKSILRDATTDFVESITTGVIGVHTKRMYGTVLRPGAVLWYWCYCCGAAVQCCGTVMLCSVVVQCQPSAVARCCGAVLTL